MGQSELPRINSKPFKLRPMKSYPKIYFINVPINQQGIEERESWDELMPNVRTFELTTTEYDRLIKVFNVWNKAFDLFIDSFEEEEMQAEDVPEALSLLDEFINKSDSSEFLAAVQKLKSGLQLAVDLGMKIYFDF